MRNELTNYFNANIMKMNKHFTPRYDLRWTFCEVVAPDEEYAHFLVCYIKCSTNEKGKEQIKFLVYAMWTRVKCCGTETGYICNFCKSQVLWWFVSDALLLTHQTIFVIFVIHGFRCNFNITYNPIPHHLTVSYYPKTTIIFNSKY